MKRLAPIAVMGVLALTLASCGGSGGDSGDAGGSGSTGGSGDQGSSASASGGSGSGADNHAGGSGDAGSSSGTSGAASGSSDGGSDATYADGKTLTIVVNADPGGLDPQMTSMSATLQFDQFLYDKLLGVDPDGNLVPRLAESWDATATEATFTLRDGITCADGTPLTASVVADNINWVGNPKNASSSLGLFVPPGATATADDDARTVTVTSPAPDPFLAETLGGLYIVCPAGMDDRSLLDKGKAGTGMYTLTESVPGDHYTLTLRDDYAWGAGADYDPDAPGRAATVILKVVENESTAANLVLSGQANAVRIVGPDRERMAGKDLFTRTMETLLGELWFNHADGLPTSDVAVRTALVQALDLEQLRAVTSGGNGAPSTGLINPSQTPCPGDTVTGNLPAHDVEAAKATLDAAGWTAGGDGVRAKDGKQLALTLYFPSSLGPNMQAGAELMQAAWSAVGAKVTIKPMTDTQMSKIMLAGQGHWDAGIVPLGLPLPTQLVPFVSGPGAPNGQNFSGIDNADFQAAVKKAMGKVGQAGCSDWADAEVALFSNVDLVPFANSTVPWFAKGVTFELDQGTIDPASIRMLA